MFDSLFLMVGGNISSGLPGMFHTDWVACFTRNPGMFRPDFPTDRFKDIFNSIGYGETRQSDETNSYFGLGLMSVLQMGNKAIIFSKEIDTDQTNYYTIETQQIFSDKVESQPVDNIKDFISMDVLSSSREELSPLSDDIIMKYNQGVLPESFTEIILQNVDDNIIEKVSSEEYVKQLMKILPLKPDYNDPFFNHIQDKAKLENIKENIFNNLEYCKNIRVFYGNISSEAGYKELNKYYPEFINDVIFTDADIQLFISKDNLFIGYLLISSQDIEDRNKKNIKEEEEEKEDQRLDETGFWVRNRNFLVKSADFFQKPGTRKKIVDEPLKTWIYAEIFHKDMTKMLVVTRDEYLWDNKDFLGFYSELKGFISNINTEYREIWKKGKKVVEALVEPFFDIRKVFEKFDKVLIESGILTDEKESGEYLSKISKVFSNTNIEDRDAIIENLLKKNQSDLLLADNVQGDIKIVITKKPLLKNFIRERDSKSKNLIIKISPDVFSSFRTTFMGKSFQVNYVLKSHEKSDLSINIDKEEIYINLSSQDLAKYRLTFIEFIMIAKIAYIESNDKDEMLRTILDLLGTRRYLKKDSSIQPGIIFSSLEDILRRS